MPDTDDRRQALLQRLESLRAAGVEQLPRAAAPVVADVASEPPPAAPRPNVPQPSAQQSNVEEPTAEPNATPVVDRDRQPVPPSAALFADAEPAPVESTSVAATLEVLQQEVAACTRCHELATTRKQTVFGVGDPNARLVFLGEAPGADEDRLGEPFVGRAGQLLDKIIEACTLRRSEVYILNILKCRPPGNRNPTPDESSNCKHFLRRQLELIAPEYVCCLGAVAAQNLLETTTSISRLRGRTRDYRGVKVVCTYHPAYLLRNPSAKKDTWEDMKMLMRLMGVEL